MSDSKVQPEFVALGNQLKAQRKYLGKSLASMSNLVGLSLGALSNIECGRLCIPREREEAFAQAYGWPLESVQEACEMVRGQRQAHVEGRRVYSEENPRQTASVAAIMAARLEVKGEARYRNRVRPLEEWLTSCYGWPRPYALTYAQILELLRIMARDRDAKPRTLRQGLQLAMLSLSWHYTYDAKWLAAHCHGKRMELRAPFSLEELPELPDEILEKYRLAARAEAEAEEAPSAPPPGSAPAPEGAPIEETPEEGER